MILMRKFVVSLVVATAVSAFLGGCGDSGASTSGSKTTPSPSLSPSPKPAELLTAAVAKTASSNFKITMVGDGPDDSLSGTYDGTNKLAMVGQSKDGETLQIVVTSDDLYMSGIKELSGTTVRMSLSKLQPKSGMILLADVVVPLILLPSATAVTSTGAGAFAGTIDLTKVSATTVGSKKFIEAATAAAGAKANALSFTATVDAQGYVNKFSTLLPAMDDGKDGKYDVTYSEFGAPVTITKPSGPKVIDAPDSAYTE